MQKITTFLWFDKEAEEAANSYVTIFKNSKILGLTRYGDAGPGPKGTVMTINFQLDGQEFAALNGGPLFKFSEAVSLVVNCETQEEVDEMWEKLSAGGQPGQCGWLKDRFGLSWQVVPKGMGALLQGSDPVRSKRVMEALMQMRKLDINRLKQAYESA